MRVVHLVAGAGGMYCGSCLFGNALAAALRRAGCDAILAPVYTPLRTDEPDVSLTQVALGGLNVYLQHRWPATAKMPRWIKRLLDNPRLLRFASRLAVSNRPQQLGELTVATLQADEGPLRGEIDRLVDWLAAELRPDVVHLNNALLVGLAREVRRRLGAAVVCTLSGEDVFLEKLPQPFAAEAQRLLRQRCAELDALIAPNRYYADAMAGYLNIAPDKIDVIPLGLNLEGFPKPGQKSARQLRQPRQRATIGYLARVCPDKGLHLLAEALRVLCNLPTMPPVEVCAAGYLHPADRPYLEDILRQLAQWNIAERLRYLGELDRPGKIALLQSIDVLCVPTIYRESKGLYVLEAWAAGVPAVLPAHGAFPEMVADTGGGLLFAPGDVYDLADTLKRMILNRQLAAECGLRAQQAVHRKYDIAATAQRVLELYQRIRPPGPRTGEI